MSRLQGTPKEGGGVGGKLLLLWPIIAMGAVGLAVWLQRHPPDSILAIVLGCALVLGAGWILVCIAWPAYPDRFCPRCRQRTLERSDPKSTLGVTCSACGWRDPDQSSWYMAEEEEESLEDLIGGLQSVEKVSPRDKDEWTNPN